MITRHKSSIFVSSISVTLSRCKSRQTSLKSLKLRRMGAALSWSCLHSLTSTSFSCLSLSIQSWWLPPTTIMKMLLMNRTVLPWCGTSNLRNPHLSTSFTVRYLSSQFLYNLTGMACFCEQEVCHFLFCPFRCGELWECNCHRASVHGERNKASSNLQLSFSFVLYNGRTFVSENNARKKRKSSTCIHLTLLDGIISDHCLWRPVVMEETEVLVGNKLIDKCDANSKWHFEKRQKEGGSEGEREDGRTGCEGSTAPRRQARPYRDVLVVKRCGLPLPNPRLPHVCVCVCVSPPTLMLHLKSEVLLPKKVNLMQTTIDMKIHL